VDRVDVRVAERGDCQPSAQVKHPGEGPGEIADLVIAAQCLDDTAADRGRLREAGRVGLCPDLPVDEDKLRALRTTTGHELGCYRSVASR
jgi:hypothetical protein